MEEIDKKFVGVDATYSWRMPAKVAQKVAEELASQSSHGGDVTLRIREVGLKIQIEVIR